MKEDLKIFLKYVFSLKGFLEGIRQEIRALFNPKILSILLFGVAIFVFLEIPSPKGGRIAAILIILSLLLQLRLVYIGGDHRRWYRKKYGLKSKKELIRTEFEENEKGGEIEKLEG
ncbi:MAG: hypothetical protein KKB31_04450 [Nanoarchaeota archaeon]|nr:hypothetical protein [Nanoarchaeota archaeon]